MNANTQSDRMGKGQLGSVYPGVCALVCPPRHAGVGVWSGNESRITGHTICQEVAPGTSHRSRDKRRGVTEGPKPLSLRTRGAWGFRPTVSQTCRRLDSFPEGQPSVSSRGSEYTLVFTHEDCMLCRARCKMKMQASSRDAPDVGPSRAQAVQAAWATCPGSRPGFQAENVHAALKRWPGKVLAVSRHTLFQGPEAPARPGPPGNAWNVGSGLEKVFLGTSGFQKGEAPSPPSPPPHVLGNLWRHLWLSRLGGRGC